MRLIQCMKPCYTGEKKALKHTHTHGDALSLESFLEKPETTAK